MTPKHVYSIELTLAATAYVKANTAIEAKLCLLDLLGQSTLGIPISGLQYTDPRLPTLSLSPAMTVLKVKTRSIDEVL